MPPRAWRPRSGSRWSRTAPGVGRRSARSTRPWPYEFTPDERAIADEFLTGAAIGGPVSVAERLRALARDTGANELMVSTLVPDLAARQRALEHIAAAMA